MRKATTKTGKKDKAVQFQLVMASGNDVYVAGSFNNWDTRTHPVTFAAEAGSYQTTLMLAPGRHEYKFVVNGKWRTDPKCPETIPNPLGSVNSVITV